MSTDKKANKSHGLGLLDESDQSQSILIKGVLVAFFISMLLPISFQLGTLRFTPTRTLLLFAFIPLFLRLVRGQAGRLMAIDVFLMLYCAWIAITLLIHHGASQIPLIGITIVEIFGGYLLGRTLILNKADYQRFFRYYLLTLIFLFPVAILELLTAKNLLDDIFRPFFSLINKIPPDPRYGLERVTTSFEHPIIFGLFCSFGVINFLLIHYKTRIKSWLAAALALSLTFMALSSAPLLAVVLQLGLLTWAKLTKSKWKLLIVLLLIPYVVVDVLSNRTPVTILINYITFNPATAWGRIVIWDYGIAAAWTSPITGIGLNDWPRPNWVPPSVDNFWLLNAMRHGFVGAAVLIIGLASGFFAVARRKIISEEIAKYRMGYIITLTGLFFTLTTVHIWGDTSSFVMSFIGAGIWFAFAADSPSDTLDPKNDDPEQETSRITMQKGPKRAITQTTRFQNKT